MSISNTRLLAVLPAVLALLLSAPVARARNLMTADGPGNTYELLRQAYTTELPDCGHMVPHITEEMDNDLKKPVFIFHAHVNEDDDRCGGTDRQRTEIRARATDIVAQNNETVYYRWKFKLDAGFKGSNRFTHIFQIKSDLGAPIMTLTPRVSTFGTTGRVASAGTTELAKFLGVWVVVRLKVHYSNSGRTELTIRRLSDGAMLYSQAGDADMWDDNASGHDSKFGIYRSLDSREQLRDEQVRFADFCASKVSAAECEEDGNPPPPPADAGAPVPPDAGGGGGAGGAGGAGGSGGSGGMGGSGGGEPEPPPAPPADARPRPPGAEPPSNPETLPPGEIGCGCRLGATPGNGGAAAAFLIGCAALMLLRRRRRR
jgi:hypothetical protein